MSELKATLTWADDDVKSWHNKSTQSAENTTMAPSSPSKPRVYVEKRVKSRVPAPFSLTPSVGNWALFPSRRGARLLNAFLFGSR